MKEHHPKDLRELHTHHTTPELVPINIGKPYSKLPISTYKEGRSCNYPLRTQLSFLSRSQKFLVLLYETSRFSSSPLSGEMDFLLGLSS